MIKNWDTNEIKDAISHIGYRAKDHGLTGFITWPMKQDLYEILWHTEEVLKNCSTYGDLEKEFVNNHEKHKTWESLKK